MYFTSCDLKKTLYSLNLSEEKFDKYFSFFNKFFDNMCRFGCRTIDKSIDDDILKEEPLILSFNNCQLSYLFARMVKGADIRAHQDVIIKSGDLDYICKFAKNIKSADIDILQDTIIKSCSLKHIFDFAVSVNGADVNRLSNIILDSNDVQYNYKIAKAFCNGYKNDFNLIKHENVVIESGDALFNYYYARDIKGADIRAHGDAVIASGNGEYNYYFAKKINGADVKGHIDALIASHNPEFIYKFVRDRIEWIKKEPLLESISVRQCGESIVKSGNLFYNYCFAKNVDGADICAHALPIINSGNAKYNYLFAEYAKKSSLDKSVSDDIIDACGNAVITSGFLNYNYLFAKKIGGKNIYSHIEAALVSMKHNYFVISVDENGNVKKAKVKKLR